MLPLLLSEPPEPLFLPFTFPLPLPLPLSSLLGLGQEGEGEGPPEAMAVPAVMGTEAATAMEGME
jgi:hypothetical protein